MACWSMPSKRRAHVVEGGDGDADAADFAEGSGVVGVHAELGGEVEGDGEAGGAACEEEAVAAVGFFGGGEAGVLAHGPAAGAVHGGVDAAGVGELAGIGEDDRDFGGGVDGVDFDAGVGGDVAVLGHAGLLGLGAAGWACATGIVPVSRWLVLESAGDAVLPGW